MFNNLVESSSHAKEFKRRGSFLLFTTATYVLLFVITGVVSIYAYDTHLEQQNLEIVTLLSPQEFPEPVPRPIADPPRNISNTRNNNEAFDVFRRPTADVNQPTLAPPDISTKPNPDLPVRNVPFRIGETDSYATTPGGNRGVPAGNGGNVPIVIPDDPPPAPTPAPVVPRIVKVSQQVLTSKALSLPKPPYPNMAKLSHVQGTVTVQVLIDETGKVVSAKAVSGHVLLVPDAQRAALQARFSPTTIGGVAVKVSGVIAYNFVLP